MRGGRLSDTDGQGRATTHGGLGNVSNREKPPRAIKAATLTPSTVFILFMVWVSQGEVIPTWPEHTLKSLFIWHSAHVAVPSRLKGKLTCAHL